MHLYSNGFIHGTDISFPETLFTQYRTHFLTIMGRNFGGQDGYACPIDSGFASGRAMIRAGNNDTSVIRSPAVKKAGRLDSYGAVRKPPPDDFPPELSSIFSGVSWTNVRKIITFVEKSLEILFSAAFHYIPHT
jgi:hypothetical protein